MQAQLLCERSSSTEDFKKAHYLMNNDVDARSRLARISGNFVNVKKELLQAAGIRDYVTVSGDRSLKRFVIRRSDKGPFPSVVKVKHNKDGTCSIDISQNMAFFFDVQIELGKRDVCVSAAILDGTVRVDYSEVETSHRRRLSGGGQFNVRDSVECAQVVNRLLAR